MEAMMRWAVGFLAATLACGTGLRAQPQRAPARRPGIAAPRPDRALERLSRMSPEQRRRLLERLPPERRQRVEKQLEWYNSLTPDERDRLRQQLERFSDLPAERQDAARKLFRRFLTLSRERQQLLEEEFQRLGALEPAERLARLNSEECRSRYTQFERRLLQDYVDLLEPPR